MKYLFNPKIFVVVFIIYCNLNHSGLKSAIQTNFSTKQPNSTIQQSKYTKKTDSVLSKLKKSIADQNSYLYMVLLSFLAGILISFTPCVYPMIPVTAGILQTQATSSIVHNFLASLFYVLGMAFVYAGLGVISATTSLIFGQWTSSPIFISFIITLFIFLAFSLFGFYEIRIPQFLTKAHKFEIHEQKSLVQPLLLGFFSGAITSPCITPALAVLLTLVADKGNPILGFFALFFFALGMGTLLVIIGTASTALNTLPKAGEWMLEVKRLLGFLMLFMCVYFLKPLVSTKIFYAFYLSLIILVLIYFLIRITIRFKSLPKNESPKIEPR